MELNTLLAIHHGQKPLDHILTGGDKARSSSREGEHGLHQCHVLSMLFDLFFLYSAQCSVASGFIISDCFLNMLLLFLPLVHLAVRAVIYNPITNGFRWDLPEED